MANWWKNAVGYQIYPRSFMDSNDDGIGDLKGIQAKIPYLKELGIDFIWLNPIYQSPNVDNGYDISDYQAINPEFGTLEDLKELIQLAHDNQIKLIMDLVINHTSDQHPWFLESKKSKENPYRDYYLWADASPEKMPNNWQSFFGGSTWTYDSSTKQAYFHVFAKEQPDLNWKNPAMRKDIYQMIRWWLDFGIDGFRLDAISHIQKQPWDFKITDNPWAPFMNVAGIETYMAELKEIFRSYNIMTVGEASGVSSKSAALWTDPEDGYIDMIFELEHQVRTGEPGYEIGSLPGFKKVLSRWQKDLQPNGWNALYIDNHDNPRSNSIFGNETNESATALATAYLLLRGTPFIYQGQELGMTNFPFESIDELRTTESLQTYHDWLNKGLSQNEALRLTTRWTRDHSRTPMHWTELGGFSTNQPWMKLNTNTDKINVAIQQANPASPFNYYKKLITLRKSLPVFTSGSYQIALAKHPSVWAYTRKDETNEVFVLTNLSEKEQTITLPNYWTNPNDSFEVLLTNYPNTTWQKKLILRPYEAIVVKKH
ncbi:alpha-glucosidase [Enterococcus devriesei]|uniref:glycoside hydrolase family 13 protein n=1 Tax=Enterococcus devriesei TaxID=319970 RepID=UPI001C11F3EF|nr:alpha-glucosidase [Enterococcus devriesei]MBU5365228.1 alpha-glucosidase [Enterococcus devriesei]MDT2821168.1 alpha-glucosidase [Enterococcus devriesei]